MSNWELNIPEAKERHKLDAVAVNRSCWVADYVGLVLLI
jgi:hypothetical protein